MLIRLFWAFALLGATCMAQNANQVAHKAAIEAHEQALRDAKTTPPPKTGNPNIDYKYDPNLPAELHGYDLSNYPFYNGLPDDLLEPSIYNFTCDGRLDGFYASVHHQCQVYHNCLFNQRYDFLCANYTVFDQKNFICHYVSLVDCKNSAKHFDRNEELHTTRKPEIEPQVFRRRPEVEVVYVDRPVGPRPNRQRPNRPRIRPFSSNNRRPPPPTTTTSQPAAYDDYYDYDYAYNDEYYGDYYDYADEPKTTTTTTQAPPPRRRRPQRPGQGQGRRPAGNRIRSNARPIVRAQDDSRPLEQDISPANKDTQNNEPEVRRPAIRRRPAARPNRPVVRNTTPADPFSDYYDYDYDNSVSDEPSIPTTTLAPVVNGRRPSRPRINPRKPEATTEEALLENDQETENNNSPSVVARERKPINGRRPFRPAAEESSSVPRRSGGGSVVNGRQRPTAVESSPREDAPARESLGSGRRPGPSFPSRRKPATRTQTEEPVNEEPIIEEDPPLAPAIEITADETIPEETLVEEESIPRSAAPGRRVRVGGQRRRPQRQSPAYSYYDN